MSLLQRVISRSCPTVAWQLSRSISTTSYHHTQLLTSSHSTTIPSSVNTGLSGIDFSLTNHKTDGQCNCLACRSITNCHTHPGKCGGCPQCCSSSSLPSVSNMTSRFMLAGSPLFLTEFDKPFYFPEVQFILSDKLNFIFERFFETECGVWLINTLAVYTLMRMFFYYFWWQPSALNHFKDRYGQTWNVGHHLYGTDAPNPLKKETKGGRK